VPKDKVEEEAQRFLALYRPWRGAVLTVATGFPAVSSSARSRVRGTDFHTGRRTRASGMPFGTRTSGWRRRVEARFRRGLASRRPAAFFGSGVGFFPDRRCEASAGRPAS